MKSRRLFSFGHTFGLENFGFVLGGKYLDFSFLVKGF